MKNLQQFNQDTDTKENVRNYFIDILEKEAIRRVFDREDVTALAEAREIINKAFDNLDVLFPQKVVKKNIENEAR